jgi:hypothetical protein
MKTRTLLVAAGLLAVSVAPALADSVTAKVLNWDPSNRTITLQDHSQFMNIAPSVAVPSQLIAGDSITVKYAEVPESDGVQSVSSVTLLPATSVLSASTNE